MPNEPASVPDGSGGLFDPAFLAGLARLKLVARRRLAGRRHGDRISRRHGASLDFADHRDYSPGDDPRSLDWNAYGRLGRLYVKRFHDEEDMHVMILVDASGSMRWGPEGRKFAHARRMAAAVGCVGLAGMHEVSVGWFGSRLGDWLGALRGEASIHRVLEFLGNPGETGGSGPTSLETSLSRAARSVRRRTLAVVVSDFLDSGGCERGLSALRFRRFATVAIQVTDPLERDPELVGEFRLLDAESGGSLPVSADRELLAAYRARRESYFERLHNWCRAHEVIHVESDADADPSRMVLGLMKNGVLSR